MYRWARGGKARLPIHVYIRRKWMPFFARCLRQYLRVLSWLLLLQKTDCSESELRVSDIDMVQLAVL
jgi:hypothetical protein